jgi:hypothetical protein
MAHADDATKEWVSAIPTKDSNGKVMVWKLKYKYTLAVSGKADYVHTFNHTIKIDTPSKAPASYTKAELLSYKKYSTDSHTLSQHMDDMFNKKYAEHIASQPTITTDTSFDVSTLNDS